MQNTELTFNVLEFDHARERIGVYVGATARPGGFRLSKRDVETIGKMNESLAAWQELYAYPGTEQPEKCVEVDLPVSPQYCHDGEKAWSFSFLKKYYTAKLAEYFKGLGMPVRNNFVSDTDVWVKCSSPYKNCDGYRVITLRVQFTAPSYGPELLVIVGDVHSVYRKPVNDALFADLPTDTFTNVLFRNGIYRYDKLPEIARRSHAEVFPCINFGLLRALDISRPKPAKGNRYETYWTEAEKFRTGFLSAASLQDIMKLQDAWKKMTPMRLPGEKMALQFGTGVHAEPKYGFRQFGPRELLEDNVVFFFILHQDDRPLSFTVNDYLKGNETSFKGGLNDFLKIKYTTEPKLSIVFADKDNPLKEIAEKLESKRSFFLPGKRYVAIYLSPHNKVTHNSSHKMIYYRIKEHLLMRGIISQTIDANKTWGSKREKAVVTVGENKVEKAVLETAFHFSLPNILVAIHAKLGGTPWCFEQQATDELVIGISAYQSRDLDKKYLGSTFTFTNEGRFEGFNCFKSTQISELAGSISLAVKNYCQENEGLQRLVIHFYKRLSRRELEPIEKALANLRLKVPVVVVSVNKTFSEDMVGFDMARSHKMPLSGHYLPIQYSQYLLYNNQQLTGTEKINEREGYPFPLKVTVQQFLPGNHDDTPVSDAEAAILLEQVCRFSQLYWKSVSRQWMPVTLRYPEMLAQIYPHFKYKDLTDAGNESLWFL